MARVKGIVFRNATRELEKLKGGATVERVLDTLPAELADGIRYGTIGARAWVPLEWQRQLLGAIADETGGGTAITRELGRRTISSDLSGVYRIFTRMVGPERVLAISTRFFGQYYDEGRALVHESRRGYALAAWEGCPGFDSRIWSSVLGGAEAILTVCGAKEVRVHVRAGGGDDDDFMRVEGFWI
jgi:hypothetical protein